MPYITVSSGVRVYFEDWGHGAPIVLIHGWPLSHRMFEYQAHFLASHGQHRVVALDLRGFGMSDKPWSGCDYETWCHDLEKLIVGLDLQDITICGFSMGGALAMRYVESRKDKRVTQLALLAAAGPCLSRKIDNPQGVPREVLNGMVQANETDRSKLYSEFGRNLFHRPVESAFSQWLHTICMQSSIRASIRGIEEFRDHDFRNQLQSIHVPTRIFHGVHDKVVPFALAEVQMRFIPQATLVRFENSGHGLFADEKDKLNEELLKFIEEKQPAQAA